MITDGLIDDVNAKYWCAFADDFFKDLVRKVKNPDLAKDELKNDLKNNKKTALAFSNDITESYKHPLNSLIIESIMTENDETDRIIEELYSNAKELNLTDTEINRLISEFTTGKYAGTQDINKIRDLIHNKYLKSVIRTKAVKEHPELFKKLDTNSGSYKYNNEYYSVKGLKSADPTKDNGYDKLYSYYPEIKEQDIKAHILSNKLLKLTTLKKGSFTTQDSKGRIISKNIDDIERDMSIQGIIDNALLEFTTRLFVLLKKIGITAATIAGAVGAGYLLYKAFPYLSLKFKYLYKKMSSGQSLAYTKFEADDEGYIFKYDIKYHKWILEYTDAKLLLKKSFPERSDVDSFCSTDFCKNFVKQCEKYLNPILNDKQVQKIFLFEAKKIDDKLYKLLNDIIKNKSHIEKNMFNIKYKYQD